MDSNWNNPANRIYKQILGANHLWLDFPSNKTNMKHK